MKAKKLLEKLRELVDGEVPADKQRLKKLAKVLKQLKEKQHKLEKRLANGLDEDDKRRITNKLKILCLQREKGIESYMKLKKSLNKKQNE